MDSVDLLYLIKPPLPNDYLVLILVSWVDIIRR